MLTSDKLKKKLNGYAFSTAPRNVKLSDKQRSDSRESERREDDGPISSVFCGKKIYLELSHYREVSLFEKDLRKLGAVTEEFFTETVNCVISDSPDAYERWWDRQRKEQHRPRLGDDPHAADPRRPRPSRPHSRLDRTPSAPLPPFLPKTGGGDGDGDDDAPSAAGALRDVGGQLPSTGLTKDGRVHHQLAPGSVPRSRGAAVLAAATGARRQQQQQQLDAKKKSSAAPGCRSQLILQRVAGQKNKDPTRTSPCRDHLRASRPVPSVRPSSVVPRNHSLRSCEGDKGSSSSRVLDSAYEKGLDVWPLACVLKYLSDLRLKHGLVGIGPCLRSDGKRRKLDSPFIKFQDAKGWSGPVVRELTKVPVLNLGNRFGRGGSIWCGIQEAANSGLPILCPGVKFPEAARRDSQSPVVGERKEGRDGDVRPSAKAHAQRRLQSAVAVGTPGACRTPSPSLRPSLTTTSATPTPFATAPAAQPPSPSPGTEAAVPAATAAAVVVAAAATTTTPTPNPRVKQQTNGLAAARGRIRRQFCEYCRVTFTDYLKHTTSLKHKSAATTSPRRRRVRHAFQAAPSVESYFKRHVQPNHNNNNNTNSRTEDEPPARRGSRGSSGFVDLKSHSRSRTPSSASRDGAAAHRRSAGSGEAAAAVNGEAAGGRRSSAGVGDRKEEMNLRNAKNPRRLKQEVEDDEDSENEVDVKVEAARLATTTTTRKGKNSDGNGSVTDPFVRERITLNMGNFAARSRLHQTRSPLTVEVDHPSPLPSPPATDGKLPRGGRGRGGSLTSNSASTSFLSPGAGAAGNVGVRTPLTSPSGVFDAGQYQNRRSRRPTLASPPCATANGAAAATAAACCGPLTNGAASSGPATRSRKFSDSGSSPNYGTAPKRKRVDQMIEENVNAGCLLPTKLRSDDEHRGSGVRPGQATRRRQKRGTGSATSAPVVNGVAVDCDVPDDEEAGDDSEGGDDEGEDEDGDEDDEDDEDDGERAREVRVPSRRLPPRKRYKGVVGRVTRSVDKKQHSTLPSHQHFTRRRQSTSVPLDGAGAGQSAAFTNGDGPASDSDDYDEEDDDDDDDGMGRRRSGSGAGDRSSRGCKAAKKRKSEAEKLLLENKSIMKMGLGESRAQTDHAMKNGYKFSASYIGASSSSRASNATRPLRVRVDGDDDVDVAGEEEDGDDDAAAGRAAADGASGSAAAAGCDTTDDFVPPAGVYFSFERGMPHSPNFDQLPWSDTIVDALRRKESGRGYQDASPKDWYSDLDTVPVGDEDDDEESAEGPGSVLEISNRSQHVSERFRNGGGVESLPAASTSASVCLGTPRMVKYSFRPLPVDLGPEVRRRFPGARSTLSSARKGRGRSVTFDESATPSGDDELRRGGGGGGGVGVRKKAKNCFRKSPRCHASTVEFIYKDFSPTKGGMLLESVKAGRRLDEDDVVSPDGSFDSPSTSTSPDGGERERLVRVVSPTTFRRPPTDDPASFLSSVANQVEAVIDGHVSDVGLVAPSFGFMRCPRTGAYVDAGGPSSSSSSSGTSGGVGVCGGVGGGRRKTRVNATEEASIRAAKALSLDEFFQDTRTGVAEKTLDNVIDALRQAESEEDRKRKARNNRTSGEEADAAEAGVGSGEGARRLFQSRARASIPLLADALPSYGSSLSAAAGKKRKINRTGWPKPKAKRPRVALKQPKTERPDDDDEDEDEEEEGEEEDDEEDEEDEEQKERDRRRSWNLRSRKSANHEDEEEDESESEDENEAEEDDEEEEEVEEVVKPKKARVAIPKRRTRKSPRKGYQLRTSRSRR